MVRFIHGKNETADVLVDMIREIENTFNVQTKKLKSKGRRTIKWLRTDERERGGGVST